MFSLVLKLVPRTVDSVIRGIGTKYRNFVVTTLAHCKPNSILLLFQLDPAGLSSLEFVRTVLSLRCHSFIISGNGDLWEGLHPLFGSHRGCLNDRRAWCCSRQSFVSRAKSGFVLGGHEQHQWLGLEIVEVFAQDSLIATLLWCCYWLPGFAVLLLIFLLCIAMLLFGFSGWMCWDAWYISYRCIFILNVSLWFDLIINSPNFLFRLHLLSFNAHLQLIFKVLIIIL